MNNINIFLLDETSGHSDEIAAILKRKDIFCVKKVNAQKNLPEVLNSGTYDIILTLLPNLENSKPLLEQIKATQKDTPVIFLSTTASQDADTLMAKKAGVFDCLEHQVEPGRLLEVIERAASISKNGSCGKKPAMKKSSFGEIIGESEKMKKIFSLMEKVCDTDTTLLIQGESGTGKELIAQALHYHGARQNGPFVPVNCGAIPGELLESELFGHEKGAFTHAIRTRIGRFEMANAGTVFLDEISEMSPMLQVKILRVLQEKKFERIGGTKTIKSDFRILAATNRNLEEEVKAGRFREDLYYRLNVIPINAPPLRERPTDIPLLVDNFIAKFNRSKKKTVTGMAPEVLAGLMQYPWPGNVRELENIIERMVILAAGAQLTMEDLPVRISESEARVEERQDHAEIPTQGFMLSEVVSDFEKRLIIRALNQTGWVKNRAAKLLNVNRTTLIEKMKRYKIVSQQTA